MRKHGLFSGYDEYRYGAKRPVYIPGQKFTDHLTKDRIEQLASQAADLLHGWTRTPFEFEGPCVSGLRRALCLDGHSWLYADDIARTIVRKALGRMMARRPTWEEGQHTYIIARENCARCAADLDEDQITYKDRYCSTHCAKAAVESRNYETRKSDSELAMSAYRLLRRDARPKRDCQCCGKTFQPRQDTGTGQFCSTACRSASTRKHAPRPCGHCNIDFQPTGQGERYCSNKCRGQALRVPRFEKTCLLCGGGFVAKMARANFCSKSCGVLHHEWSRSAPKQLNWRAFDHFITAPINASRPAWITPERFDELVAA